MSKGIHKSLLLLIVTILIISLATLAEARSKNKFRYKNKTYHTYTKYNPEIDKVYAGRTSGGSGTLKDIARRDKRHHKNKDGYL